MEGFRAGKRQKLLMWLDGCKIGLTVESEEGEVPHLRWSQAPPLPWPRPGSADYFYLFFLLFSSLTLPISAFHLSILSELRLLNFLRLVLCIQFFTLHYTLIWVCLKIGYIPNYSHLIGIMISKTIGFRGTQHFQTHPYSNYACTGSSFDVTKMMSSRKHRGIRGRLWTFSSRSSLVWVL